MTAPIPTNYTSSSESGKDPEQPYDEWNKITVF